MNDKLKIAIGTDAFPPTTDGISNVAQSYAEKINQGLGKAVIVTPKNPNQQDYKYPYEIFRYKSWWIPTKEGYSVGWPFKPELHQAIIDRHFDLLHSHCGEHPRLPVYACICRPGGTVASHSHGTHLSHQV